MTLDEAYTANQATRMSLTASMDDLKSNIDSVHWDGLAGDFLESIIIYDGMSVCANNSAQKICNVKTQVDDSETHSNAIDLALS